MIKIKRLLFLCFITSLLWAQSSYSASEHFITLPGQSVGLISKKLSDLSGLAHCASTPNSLWSINDRGDGAMLYELSLAGKLLKRYHIAKAINEDWEDVACGRCAAKEGACLYIGDLGSKDQSRDTVSIYMIELPPQPKTKAEGAPLGFEEIQLKYPERSHNAEALIAHPNQARLWVVSKEKTKGQHTDPSLYSADLSKLSEFPALLDLTFEGLIPLSQVLPFRKKKEARTWITGGDFYPPSQELWLISNELLFRAPWPLASEKSSRIRHPLWILPSRPQIESLAIHVNQQQFWLASESNSWKEPLLLMTIPQPPKTQ